MTAVELPPEVVLLRFPWMQAPKFAELAETAASLSSQAVGLKRAASFFKLGRSAATGGELGTARVVSVHDVEDREGPLLLAAAGDREGSKIHDAALGRY